MLPLTQERHSDEETMRAIAAGDFAALEQLHTRFFSKLSRLAFGVLLDRAEAEDVVQDVFVKLPQVALRWQPSSTLDAWMTRVTLNEALAVRRRIQRFVREWSTSGSVKTPEELAQSRELVAR